MNLSGIYDRVTAWNSARYPREYNHNLAMALLREEYAEYLEAKEPVDQVDALCDLAFVAMGVIWKCDVSDTVFTSDLNLAQTDASNLITTNTLMPVYFIPAVIDMCDKESEYPTSYAMHLVLSFTLVQLSAHFSTREAILKALLVVCDSNDSKTVTKTDPSVKANINKGNGFIKPEPRLQELLDNERHS